MKGISKLFETATRRKTLQRLLKTKCCLGATSILAVLFLISFCGTAWGYTTSQITNNTSSDLYPKVNSSGQVVWAGWDGADYEIYLYSDGVITQLTNNSTWFDRFPKINDSGQVVWESLLDPGVNRSYDIFFYENGVTTRLSNNTRKDEDAKINASGQVVWAGWDGVDYEIYLYKENAVSQITNNTYDDKYAVINASGQVSWIGNAASVKNYPSIYNNEVFLFSGGVTTRLTNDAYADADVRISDNGQVVWGRSGGEILLYNGSQTTVLTQSGWSFRINANGQVVWSSRVGSDNEIFLYIDGATYQLTNNTTNDGWPEINNNNQVVWREVDYAVNFINIFSNGVTTRICQTAEPGSFHINDSGQVVWSASDGTDSEIFLASPDPCSGGQPSLSLHKTGVYWASYSDYMARDLSVPLSVVNSGYDMAYKVKITGSSSTNGVTLSSVVPATLGDIAGNSNSGIILKYRIPEGVETFVSNIRGSAENKCGVLYLYPAWP